MIAATESVALQYLPLFLRGAGITLMIVLAAIVCATILGYVIAAMRLSRSKLLRAIAMTWVWIFRGIPLLLLLFFFYYSRPFGITLGAFSAGLVALTFNSSSFFSEIIRAGLQSVPKGQLEAADSVGMNPIQKFFRVTAPVSIRIMTPPYINNCVILLKESAQVSIITVPDLMLQGQKAFNATYNVTETLGIVGLIYLTMTSGLMAIQLLIEKSTGKKTMSKKQIRLKVAALNDRA